VIQCLQQPGRARAFTLIEIMVVVILIGLLSGAAMLSFAGPLRARRAHQAVEELAAFDAAARQAARNFGRDVEIVFELSARRSELVRRELTPEPRETFRVSLPADVHVEQVRAAQETSSSGDVAIRCPPRGLSRSYAVRVIGPQFDQWLLFAGLSGQVSLVTDESRIESILRNSAGGANDAARRNAD
jgi:prepilin-type N-terminal cleavage/methylation domain-containing protein